MKVAAGWDAGVSRIWGVVVRLHRDQRGATTLEWALLLAGIGLPAVVIMISALNLLVAHYRMMTLLNSLPFP